MFIREGTQEKVFKSVHDIVKHYAPALTTPLNTSLSRKTWNIRVVTFIHFNDRWFHGDINAEEAEDYLKSTKPGTFLIRFSSQVIFWFVPVLVTLRWCDSLDVMLLLMWMLMELCASHSSRECTEDSPSITILYSELFKVTLHSEFIISQLILLNLIDNSFTTQQKLTSLILFHSLWSVKSLLPIVFNIDTDMTLELVDEYHKAQVFLYPFKFDGTLSFKLTAQQAALQVHLYPFSSQV